MSELDVIVVGAGAAGLAAARQLATARLSVRVLGPIGFDRSKKIRRDSLGDFRYFAWVGLSQCPEIVLLRFAGISGSAYFVGGLEAITSRPIRASGEINRVGAKIIVSLPFALLEPAGPRR